MIYGERVRLRKNEAEDLPLFVAWLNDPEVRRGLAQYLPMSMGEEAQWFQGIMNKPAEERPLAIEIRDGDGWRLIGNTNFFDVHWVARTAEFGLFIGDKTLWHQGYGTEVTRLMLRHGFNTLNLHRIMLKVYANNQYAKRAYERAGYILEGTMRQAVYRDGKWWDVHIMSVLRPEWEANQKPGELHA